MEATEWMEEIHKNAVEHGWWDDPRTPEEITVLFLSELSEALEEYRAKRPAFYGISEDGERITDPDEIRRLGLKPEGIAVEIIDAVIRIFDYLGAVMKPDARQRRWMNALAQDRFVNPVKMRLPELLCSMSDFVMQAWRDRTVEPDMTRLDPWPLMRAAELGMAWVDAYSDKNAEGIMEIKHEYNKKRPYRHGGKAL